MEIFDLHSVNSYVGNDKVALIATLSWLNDIIAQPHIKIIHRKSICPFVKPSIDSKLMYFQIGDFFESEESIIKKSIFDLVELFDSISQHEKNGVNLKSLVIIYPKQIKDDCTLKILNIRKEIKTELLSKNIMLGFFGKLAFTTEGEIRNVDWPPPAPYPILVLRNTHETDVKFVENIEQLKILLKLF